MAAIPVNDDQEFTLETRDESPAHFLVKIESFSLLSNHGIQKYESTEFSAGGYKWKLVIYPNGRQNEEDNVDHVSAYLTMAGASSLPVNWEANAVFTVFLYNHVLDNYLCFRGRTCRFHELKPEWGFPKLISTKHFEDPLNGYLVNDNCVFGAEVFVIKSQRVFERLSLQEKHQKKHVIHILNFSQLKDVWYSDDFSAGGCNWKIQLYPNGNGVQRGKSVSIFLKLVSRPLQKKVNADYCIRIQNQNGNGSVSHKSSCWFTSSSPSSSWGWDGFVSLADIRDPMKGLVVNGRCVLEVDISVSAIVKA